MKICRKYGVNQRGRVYNLQSGKEIPEDEPLFVFRGQDRHLPKLLSIYAGMCRNENHAAAALDRVEEVVRWQRDNEDMVDEPDTDFSDHERDPVGDAMDHVLGGQAAVHHDGPLTFDSSAYARGILRMNGELEPELSERVDRLEKFTGVAGSGGGATIEMTWLDGSDRSLNAVVADQRSVDKAVEFIITLIREPVGGPLKKGISNG